MTLQSIGKRLLPAFIGAASVVVPFAANADEPATPVAHKTEQADVKISPFISFEKIKTDLTHYGYAFELSKNNPTYILIAGSKEKFDIAASHAEAIQRKMKSIYGYDTQVLFVRSSDPNACALDPYYKDSSFTIEGNKTSMRHPQDALNEWTKFAHFCEKKDGEAKNVAITTLER
jgi:hypothetical protein